MRRTLLVLPFLSGLSLLSLGCEDEGAPGGSAGGGATSSGGTTGGGGGGSLGGDSGEGGAGGAPGPKTERVTLEFRAQVGDEAFACGRTYANQGSTGAEITPRDLRFFVSSVRLIDAAGSEVPVELDELAPWQGAGVALLDFEDGTGACSNGSAPLNSIVTGHAPPGRYTGLAFSTSVPAEVNHADPTSLPPPLEVGTLHWSWLMGYIFFRAELVATAPPAGDEAPGLGVFHLGSVGCSMDGAATVCSRPHRNEIVLGEFDASRDVVVLDLARLFESADLTQSSLCHSHGELCGPYFASVGLDFESGAPLEQTAFRVEER